jgi:hypothetical protein
MSKQKYLFLSSSGMLWSVGWFRTDVSGLRIGPIAQGQGGQEESISLPLKMGPIRSPETSVRNQPTLPNIPEDDRIQANHNFWQWCVNCGCYEVWSETWVCMANWQWLILYLYKVVQIWPGLFVCKLVKVCPGHTGTTLYLAICFLGQVAVSCIRADMSIGTFWVGARPVSRARNWMRVLSCHERTSNA